jgi:Ca2+-binding RTX toxin-like protein
VYGGDGLDVLIGNTGGDRMYDWSGEFNSYFVPFSPFGEPTVVRQVSPHLQAFLLALGKEAGADQTLTEPDGELGLFTQQDPQWQANKGSPRDPQPGNTPARRDTQGAPEDDRAKALPVVGYVGPTTTSGTSTALRHTSTGRAYIPTVANGDPLAVNSSDVTVANITIAADPADPTRLALYIGGTNNAESIEVRRGSTSAYIRVIVNGVRIGDFLKTSNGMSVARIVIYGNGGNDSITIINDLGTIPTYLYGGAGDDIIRGGAGTTVIDGGDGNDRLYGGNNRDIIIGSDGADTIASGKGDDIVIGGFFVNSEDIVAMNALMAIWSSTGLTYSQRISSLRTGGGTAEYAFTSTKLFDDNLSDTVFGEQDTDWFWLWSLDRDDRKNSLETQN